MDTSYNPNNNNNVMFDGYSLLYKLQQIIQLIWSLPKMHFVLTFPQVQNIFCDIFNVDKL